MKASRCLERSRAHSRGASSCGARESFRAAIAADSSTLRPSNTANPVHFASDRSKWQRRHVYHIQAKSTIPSEAGPLSRVYTPAASSPSVHAEKVNVGSFLVSFFGSVRGGSPFRSAGRHRARAPEASPSPPRQTLRTDPVDGERG